MAARRPDGDSERSLGVELSEKLEGMLATAETAVVEMEELQGVIAEGQERGFLTTEAIAAAVEEVEFSSSRPRTC